MTHTENLLHSLESIKNINKEYYDELIDIYSHNKNFDNLSLDEYVKTIFSSEKRAFFTICSKETFNNLCTNKNWIDSIIYTPLNDHSRPYMKKGDIVFCYRQGQFSDLKEALEMRGIYALGFVASSPQILFPEKTDHNKYGVAILFPFGMERHLELRNIQLNPITISLTPYNGNRNDALQYIPENEYSKSLLEQICRKNPYLRKSIENAVGNNIEDNPLPDEIWNINPNLSENFYFKNFSQTIYYGVPGSGKSHEIDEITKGLSEEQKMRVVFHPEYTNADFVGQILPSLNEDDGKIDYKFKPGPFTKILRRAYLNPSKKYFLIIEEINRGNAAAIFGDLFQLLDRISESSSGEKIGNNSYGTGWSSYFVSNDSINAYIREYADSSIYSDVEECVVIPDENKNKDKISEKYSTVKIEDLTFTANTGIRLPPNLSILATMNTSDQNVFTLDNAFQRRWNMVLVKNEFKPESENQREAKIAGSNVSWEDFHKKINAEISKLSIENNLSSMVDKRLGCWFAKAEKNKDNRFEIKKDDFENKILKYLWDDAFKFNREFFEPVENFEELLGKVNMEAENFGVFRNLKFNENKKDSSAETGENGQN